MRVWFTEKGVEDLQLIGEWLLRTKPSKAAAQILRLRRDCERLALFQKMGACLPNGARKVVYGSFVVFFRIKDGSEIQTLLIAPGLTDWRTTLRARL